jgi:hypothetical protein
MAASTNEQDASRHDNTPEHPIPGLTMQKAVCRQGFSTRRRHRRGQAEGWHQQGKNQKKPAK